MASYPKTDEQMAQFWNEMGVVWVEQQERLDEILRPFADAALAAARPRPGERVLDIGCGCGDTTFTLADMVGPTGEVTGLDVSEPMLAHARARALKNGSNARFVHADAGSAEFPKDGYDLLFSRFGVMFFEAPERSFQHLRTALKPSGRLAFACWRQLSENPWMQLTTGAIAPFLPSAPRPDPDAPGPFAFGSRERVSRILTSAGFRDVEFAPFDHMMDMGPDADSAVREFTYRGAVAVQLSDMTESVRAEAIEAIRKVMAAHLTPQGVRMPSATWIVTAKPG